MGSLTDWLRDIPRWLLLAALIYAPWTYGCTTMQTIVGLNWILAGVVISWIAEMAFARRRASVPTVLVIISGAVLLLGWSMALNARWIYDSEYYLFIPIKMPFPHAPGSVDRAISAAWMVRATLLLLVTCFVADLSRRPVWLLRLWWTIGITGGSIALLGLLQKATGAPMIFWESTESPVATFFATYYYHANAGAFLNLVLPLACGLAFRAWTKPETPGIRATWLSVAIILLVAILANTSRMAQLIGVMLMIAMAFGSRRILLRRARTADRKTVAIGLLVVTVTLFALAQASHLDQPWRRWQTLGETLPADARWLASRVAIGAAPDAGWFGFGPGTFCVIFPYYTGGFGKRVNGVWHFLHEDYLQTFLEWGWIGSALWGAVFFGGIAMAIRSLRSRRAGEWSPRYRMVLSLSALALAGIGLHAAVDFPLQIASLQLYVATYLGLCWGSENWGKGGKSLVISGQ